MRYAVHQPGDCTIATPALLHRFDRRLLTNAVIIAIVIAILGFVGYTLRPSGGPDANFYTPGVTPKREDCVIAKMKNYAKIDKLVMQAIAQECELTVQSIEGHETLRKAWEERQAIRDATPKPAPAPEAPPPAETDRLRRVWR